MANKLIITGRIFLVLYIILIAGVVIGYTSEFGSFYFDNIYVQGLCAGLLITYWINELFVNVSDGGQKDDE